MTTPANRNEQYHLYDLDVINIDDVMGIDKIVGVRHGEMFDADALSIMYAPNLTDGVLDDPKWSLMSHGYTGQWGQANSPIMHDSEGVGGRLARDILATGGWYVAIPATYSPEEPDSDDGEWISDGWAVAYRPFDPSPCWHMGANMPECLPVDAPDCFLSHREAVAALEADMREWASDEDAAHDELIMSTVPESEVTDEDWGTVAAHVGAILKDDGPGDSGDWSATVIDNDGHAMVWWIMADRCAHEDCGRDY